MRNSGLTTDGQTDGQTEHKCTCWAALIRVQIQKYQKMEKQLCVSAHWSSMYIQVSSVTLCRDRGSGEHSSEDEKMPVWGRTSCYAATEDNSWFIWTTGHSLVLEVLSVSEQTNYQYQGPSSESENLNTMNLIDKALMRDNHYPKIRYFLRQLDLRIILDQRNSIVRLYKYMAINIRYDQEWMACHTFNMITHFIKEVKGDQQF